jgi:hypothetical protein
MYGCKYLKLYLINSLGRINKKDRDLEKSNGIRDGCPGHRTVYVNPKIKKNKNN